MTTIDYQAEAEALRDEVIARRRDFHQNPELAFEEMRTAGIVAAELGKLGLEVQTGVGKTGVVAMLDGASDGPTVLIRADMDALPILEENTTDYTSQVAGKMHACGHDGHTAIALGVAKVLTKHRDSLKGRVKFVFQPAEEIAGGAKAMITDGVLNDPRPDVSLGLHLWNSLPVGILGVGKGATMASSSIFKIIITGKGAHGAQPHQGIDPVTCAAQVITALQTIVARNVDPEKEAVVSVTTMHAGHAHNVIPKSVELTGTLRAFDIEVRDLITQRLKDIAQGIGQAMQCEVEAEVEHLTIPVVNHAEVYDKVQPRLASIVGTDKVESAVSTMGGEDMAFLMDDIPGMFFFVGSANSERELDYGHHHPRFDFDEDALPLGVATLAAAAGAYLIGG